MIGVNAPKLPALNRISVAESTSITRMFKMYDLKSNGKISAHYARKLLTALGFDVDLLSMPTNVTLGEFLLIVDTQVPPPAPSLPCSLYTFDRLVARHDPIDGKNKIRPEGLSDFMVSVGRHRIPENISAVLLFKMLEHDDCSLIPAVKVDHFDKEVINFAKKNQLYKNVDYEGIAKNAESFNHF